MRECVCWGEACTANSISRVKKSKQTNNRDLSRKTRFAEETFFFSEGKLKSWTTSRQFIHIANIGVVGIFIREPEMRKFFTDNNLHVFIRNENSRLCLSFNEMFLFAWHQHKVGCKYHSQVSLTSEAFNASIFEEFWFDSRNPSWEL